MRSIPVPPLIVLLALAACKPAAEKAKTPDLGAAMPDLPLPPNAELIGRSGSTDALQLVFQSPVAMDVIADYYRGVFTGGKWQLISDTKQADGGIALYAEQPGHPMWVRMTPAGKVTRIEVSGAVPGADSAFAARAKRAHDSTNTLVPIRRNDR